MKLIGSRLMVKRIEPTKERTSIILPGTFVEPIFMGEVIKTGPGYLDNNGNLHPCQCKIGDMIQFTSVSGWHVKVDNETYTILNERDVIVILDPEDK